MAQNMSIVLWYPEPEIHKCGYCKQLNTNCAYGMSAKILTVEDYQHLIDRGWRRSGKYCYKPIMNETCCPLYTIRCDATNFQISKSQKKIVKKFNRFLSDPTSQSLNLESTSVETEENNARGIFFEIPKQAYDLENVNAEHIDLTIINKLKNSTASNDNEEIHRSNEIESSVNSNKTSNSTCNSIKGADPNKPPRKKAKLLRLERRKQKLASKGVSPSEISNNSSTTSQVKSFEEFIENSFSSSVHKLKVCLVLTSGGNKDWNHIRSQEYPIYKKYQIEVHGDPAEKCSERQFTNFLLDSPLQSVTNPNDSSVIYGSFHQQYWLDDKLIAVGVIDILPKCISSVYFFYDPDYRHLTLGTYGSLNELYFIRQLNKKIPSIKYYYMGYYIHSCAKMRYKAKLTPSYLLCPETYMWFPIEKCVEKLNVSKYSRFNDDLTVKDKNECNSSTDLDQLMILFGYKNCIPFKNVKNKLANYENFHRFANLIGKKCIPKMLLLYPTEFTSSNCI